MTKFRIREVAKTSSTLTYQVEYRRGCEWHSSIRPPFASKRKAECYIKEYNAREALQKTCKAHKVEDAKRIISPKLKCDLFVTHRDIGQAISYMENVINRLPAAEIPAVLIGFQGFINTVIAEEDKRASN